MFANCDHFHLTHLDTKKEGKQVYIHQGQYIEKMLKKFGQTEAKSVSTPADLNVKLQKEDGVSRPVDTISYQSIVGSLLYAAITTRPDIAQAVGVVMKFCANPTQSHLTAAKRILRYLKGTGYLGLSYKKCADGNLIGYSDADWAGDVDDRHSTTGNVFLFAKGAVSWLSKKQATVALAVDNRSRVCGAEYGHPGSNLASKVAHRCRRTSGGTHRN